jgi:hypothetical protein
MQSDFIYSAVLTVFECKNHFTWVKLSKTWEPEMEYILIDCAANCDENDAQIVFYNEFHYFYLRHD